MHDIKLYLYLGFCLLFAACDPSPPKDEQTRQLAQTCAGEKAVLIEGLGPYGRDIHSLSAEAQTFFNQGLRLTYSYYFPEALASFDAALCFDPNNPMIHWGRALAIAPNPNSRYGGVNDDPAGLGWQAISQAQQLLDNRAETFTADSYQVDKGLIAALRQLFDTGLNGEQVTRSAAFINATLDLYQQFPKDPEVAFLAVDGIMMATPWQYFSSEDGKPLNLADRAQTILEQGIAQNPNHPGLNHLHIHLMENSFTPQAAESSADRLESLTPKAGHMVHMPGHIYMRLGRYADAIATNERSLLADEYFAGVWGELPFPAGTTYGLSHRSHGPHASNFIHWGAVLQGNSGRAIATIKTIVDGLGADQLQSGSAQRAIAMYWATLRFFHRWQDILMLELPADAPPYLQGMWHFVRGSALAATGEPQAAQNELDALMALTENSALLNYRAVVNTAADLLNIARYELAGKLAQTRGDYEQAIHYYQQAVQTQDQLRYMEPPDWLQSTRLSLAEAYLDSENYTEAESVYLQDLALLQENGWALYGLLQSLQAQQQEEEIQAVEQRFGKAWENADIDLGSM